MSSPTAYKLYAQTINNSLKQYAEVPLLENEFRKGRSTIDTVTIVKQIIEKQREYNLATHLQIMKKHLTVLTGIFYKKS